MATVAHSPRKLRRAGPAHDLNVEAPQETSRGRAAATVCAAYLAAASLSTLIMTVMLKLWRAHLSTPIEYFWDAILTQMWVKSVYDHGWYLHNPNLGAPAGMDMHDFPLADSLHLFLIKLLCLASPNYAVAFNLYFLLGFPLATLSSLFVLRRFGVSYPSALIASLLFTFLPYHFLRGQQHLFLSSYYVVPLSVMISLWIYLGRLGAPADDARPQPGGKGRWIGGLAVAALQSSAGVYYAFFGCFLLLVAGVAAALDARRWRPLVCAGILIVVTASGVVLNVAPSLLYWREHGRNKAVAHREAVDCEVHSLKIGQLLLPDVSHHIHRFARARSKYDRWPLAEGEKTGSSLGLIGAAGFLALIGSMLRRRSDDARPNLFSGLAVMNLFTVLLATIGGFGSLFNFLVFTQIRCYNRMSIFIGMLSLFAAALLLDRFAAWWIASGRRRWQLAALLTLLGAAGIADAAGKGRLPDYAAAQADFASDAEFTGRIESALPPAAMVFQLPYFPFPESPAIHKLWDYEQFRPYFHSRSLRWSYGAMKGREEDAWQRETAARPSAELVESIAAKGFSGIYIDRFGYADQAAALEAELTELLGRPPLVSRNARMSFFALPQPQADNPERRTAGGESSKTPRRG